MLLASLLLDSLPIDAVASSDMSPSLWLMSMLELETVPVSENISLWEGVVVLQCEVFLEIFLLFISENISMWEGVLVLE